MGDRTFDVFDWVPLIALIVATGLILSGLFPSGLGITNGNIILGRNGRIDEDKEMSILGAFVSVRRLLTVERLSESSRAPPTPGLGLIFF